MIVCIHASPCTRAVSREPLHVARHSPLPVREKLNPFYQPTTLFGKSRLHHVIDGATLDMG